MHVKLKLVSGFFGILVILVMWYAIIFPEITYLPKHYEFQAEFYGETNYLESLESDLVKVQQIDSLEHKTLFVDDDTLSIKSIWESRDRVSNKVTWTSELDYLVDRKTKKHVENYDGYFTFPNNVQKQNYEFFHPMTIVPTIFVFEKEITKNDLELYVFTCDSKRNDLSYTYPQFAPKTVYNDTICEIWVEPVSGQEVYLSQTWDNYFLEDDLKIQVEIGGDIITPFSTANLIHFAKDRKELYYFYETLIPMLISISYISVLLGMILLTEKTKNDYVNKQKTNQLEKTIKVQTSELIKAEKLSAIGTLSSRLAHDIRNPLTVIKVTLDIMKATSTNLDKKHLGYFERMDESIQRISHQVDHVLNFVQQKPITLEKTSLYSLVDLALENVNVPKNVKIEKTGDDAKIMCDKHLIMVVLINLIGNAIHAIGKQEGNIEINIDDKENNAVITVIDSGSGISDDILSQIFEPLFTTKQEGTGLGLASCKSIIEQHSGTISVNNNPTTFTVTLPKTNS